MLSLGRWPLSGAVVAPLGASIARLGLALAGDHPGHPPGPTAGAPAAADGLDPRPAQPAGEYSPGARATPHPLRALALAQRRPAGPRALPAPAPRARAGPPATGEPGRGRARRAQRRGLYLPPAHRRRLGAG